MSTKITYINENEFLSSQSQFKNLDLYYDEDNHSLWKFISPNSTKYFSTEQLKEIREVQTAVAEARPLPIKNYQPNEVKYLIFGSRLGGIFSLGGDLQSFRNCIASRDRIGLETYAKIATDAVYNHARNARNVTTFSLVQGTALGGGFEAALAGNIIVAERGVRMGFPEILFGLFPGMGAYTLLRRRVHQSIAEKIIFSAQNYVSEELYELGIIDILVDPGNGQRAINSYISRLKNRPGAATFRKTLNKAQAIDHDELYQISDDWVDAAMELPPEHLRRFDRLIKRQQDLEQNAQPFTRLKGKVSENLSTKSLS